MDLTKHPVKSKLLEKLIQNIENNNSSNPQTCRDLSRKLIIEGTKENCWYSRAYGAMSMSDYYISIGDTDTALTYLQDALEINKQYQFSDLLISNYNLLGNVQADYMNHLSAMECYLNALSVSCHTNNIAKQISIYNNIGNIFFELQSYEKALSYFLLANTQSNKINTDNRPQSMEIFGIIHCNLTTVYLKLGNLEKAQKHLEISEKYTNNPNDFTSILIRLNKANLYNALAQNEQMFAILDELAAISIYHERKDNLFELLVDAIMLLLQHHDKERIAHFLSILDSINSSANNYYHLHQYQALYVLYLEEFSDDKDLLLDAYRELYHLNTILNKKEHSNTAKSLEVKTELFNERNEKALLLESSKELQLISQFDELTGLMNRRGYNTKFNEFMQYASTKLCNIGLVLLDLDCFKEYNDNYGHIEGDRILRFIGKLLAKHSTPNIVPCRFGGDEFTIICRNCSTEEVETYIQAVMHELQATNLTHAFTKVNVNHVSLSCGFVNTKYSNAVDIQWLLGAADTALYYAKENGRNQYCNYDQLANLD